ncbi:unnamed protein product [Polarella glacialis]|uniref:Aminotransferase class I/classII large domain-containing protein n=1 Tax=Polarella glacialis TaxID=89957 RepID=A0A813FE57_POLGL|nr:unnamed protein product [Polarella glacialis]
MSPCSRLALALAAAGKRAISSAPRNSAVKDSLPKLAVTRRVEDSQPLLIKEIAAEVVARISAGHAVVNLSQGVPCLPIFKEAEERMVNFLREGHLPYSHVAGIWSVRETAAKFVNHFYGTDFTADHTIITAGGIQACFNTLALVVESKADVVLSTLPAYSLYQAQTSYFGGTFAAMTSGSDGRLRPEALHAAFDEQRKAGRRVRCVCLCTPNNPTGVVMSRQEVEELASALDLELAREPAGFLVLLDEVYLGLHDGAHVSLLQVASEQLRRRICLVLSASKGLGAMPGARAAWLTVGDKALVPEMLKVQSAVSANASTIAQVGLEASLAHCMSDPKVLQQVHDYYSTRIGFMVEQLNSLGQKYNLGVLCSHPRGAFYIWADFSGLTAVENDLQLQRLLLDRGVAVIPGSAFSISPSLKMLRINCARDDMEELQTAVRIFDETLAGLCGSS